MRRQQIVKLSHPSATYGYEGIGARGQSPGNLAVWGNYKFEINNGAGECDYWVVFESVGQPESAVVSTGNTILVQTEPEYVRSYSVGYLSQFDWIVTWRDDLPPTHVIHSHCMDGWWIKRTYDQLKNERIEKRALMSVVASDKASIPEHRRRFSFINRMIGHFKDRLTVFGSIDGQYCHDKYAAIAPYRYSIAIEAASFPDYWTEKIADCFLTETMPFYFGCPNITDYFDSECFVPIDIDDYKKSIRIIEEAIESDAYTRNRQQILSAKQRVLDELQVYPHLVRILESLPRSDVPKTRQLRPAIKTFLAPEGGWDRELMV
jgi:hypothetical protein